ncbi:hypothetical protein Poly30_05970 [Planctomycetes bacterium Poly30]|uniref:PDZ domain-containing protein n=1 Tax=Saltatorellus ferox TaxID=2528018 RepID=A0A518ELY9_9BACT|nr:hypothetical protein Poly30_05970 [Planctomycetes bacterium Poly30]
MKASHLALLTLVLGLAVGFAIGAVLNGSESKAAGAPTVGITQAASVTPDVADAAGDDRLSQVGERPVSDGPAQIAARSTSGSTAGPGARTAARKAISTTASKSAEDTSAWTHTIHGVVLNADGDPLPGVQIVSFNRETKGWRGLMQARDTSEVGRAWEGLPDVEAKLAEQAETLMADRLHASTAISDATGAFTLEKLREGVHAVQAHAEGYVFSPQMTHTGRECVFSGERVVELELDVRLPDGTQPESAVVFPGASNFGSEIAWTSESPRLRLKEASFELIVRSGNVQRLDWRSMTSDFESEPRMVNVDTEGAGPLVVELRANQILRVKVEDASELVPRIPIWVKAMPAPGGSGEIDWSEESRTALTAVPSGDFEVSGMPGGKYLLAVGRGEGNAPEITRPVTVGPGLTEVSLQIGEADLGDFLVVRCEREDGTPVDKVSFDASVQTERFARPVQIKPERRARGEYWLPRGQLFQSEQDASVELAASTETDGSASTTVETGDGDVVIEFKPACSLEIQVQGDLTAGYSVHAAPKAEGSQGQRLSYRTMSRGSQKVKEDGRAVLNALQPGTYEVAVYETGHDSKMGGYLGNSRKVVSETIEVKGLNQPLNLAIPTAHTVMVRAEGVDAGKKLQLSPKDGGYRDRLTADVGPDSMARFENVFAGEYVLRLDGGSDSKSITVPTGEVQFVTKIVYALKVRSLEEGGPAALAGFQKDDLVTEIRGKAVSGWQDLFALTKSAAVESVPVTVLRGGQSTGLSIGPVGEEDGKPKSLGMNLTPESK